jgi:3-dehydroquinate synthase
MLAQHCGRDTVILALGGGVVGDLAGFTAATYMRGIPYIQLPTTLLAMVDSSIGGKTGIDTPQGKNLIGAFWQPTAVVADLDCLKTLSPTQLINGLIEAIKMFLTSDKTGLDYVQHNLEKIVAGDIEALSYVISHAIAIKIDVVQRDEKEQNLRMILNFGHTIGHALEKMTHYDLLHGYAVGLGILVEAKIAQLKGLLSAEDYHTIEMLLAELEITRDHLLGFDPKEIIQNTKSDKKTKHGHVNYILLEKLGKYHEKNAHVAHPIDDELVTQAFLTLREVYYGRE